MDDWDIGTECGDFHPAWLTFHLFRDVGGSVNMERSRRPPDR
jgi:hypothetical protein